MPNFGNSKYIPVEQGFHEILNEISSAGQLKVIDIEDCPTSTPSKAIIFNSEYGNHINYYKLYHYYKNENVLCQATRENLQPEQIIQLIKNNAMSPVCDYNKLNKACGHNVFTYRRYNSSIEDFKSKLDMFGEEAIPSDKDSNDIVEIINSLGHLKEPYDGPGYRYPSLSENNLKIGMDLFKKEQCGINIENEQAASMFSSVVLEENVSDPMKRNAMHHARRMAGNRARNVQRTNNAQPTNMEPKPGPSGGPANC